MKQNWLGLAAGVALALAGCGGGGSGTSPQASTPTTSVRVTNVKPQRIDMKTVESGRANTGVELSADVVGDLAVLNGKTIYVLIEDPTGLFDVASTTISPTGVDNRVLLRIKSSLGHAGTTEGSLRLNVCTDIACKSPLGNSPIDIPFKLTVTPGVKIAGEPSMTVEVPFGQVERDQYGSSALRRAVTLQIPTDFLGVGSIPPFNTDWSAITPLGAPLSAQLYYGAVVPGQNIAAELALGPMPVGTHQARLKLSSSLRGYSTAAESVFDVKYVVKDSGKRMLYQPSTLLAPSPTYDAAFGVVSADGASYTGVGRVVYSANSGAVQWLYVRSGSSGASSSANVFVVGTNRCGSEVLLAKCLPAGEYTADLYLKTDAGVEAPQPYRIVMQVH